MHLGLLKYDGTLKEIPYLYYVACNPRELQQQRRGAPPRTAAHSRRGPRRAEAAAGHPAHAALGGRPGGHAPTETMPTLTVLTPRPGTWWIGLRGAGQVRLSLSSCVHRTREPAPLAGHRKRGSAATRGGPGGAAQHRGRNDVPQILALPPPPNPAEFSLVTERSTRGHTHMEEERQVGLKTEQGKLSPSPEARTAKRNDPQQQ